MEHSLIWNICSCALKGAIMFVLALMCIIHLVGAVERTREKDIFGVLVFATVLIVIFWVTLSVAGHFYYPPLVDSITPALLR